MRAGDIVPAVVRRRSRRRAAAPAGALLLRAGTLTVEVPKAGYAWTRKTTPRLSARRATSSRSRSDEGRRGDRVRDGDARAGPARRRRAARDRQPRRARSARWSAASDFARSKFNRATQALRQLGSTFKPIVYTAAIDRGYTPTSIIVDAPVTYPAGPGQPLYSPQNYDRKFEGPVTLRHALEESRNVPAVKMLDSSARPSPSTTRSDSGSPASSSRTCSLALGRGRGDAARSDERLHRVPEPGRPDEAVRGAARGGSRRQPARGEPPRAARRDPRRHGVRDDEPAARRHRRAARRPAAAALDWPLAGKTGTMDENTDAWFIGFDPDITVGVWVGYDEKKSLGQRRDGRASPRCRSGWSS